MDTIAIIIYVLLLIIGIPLALIICRILEIILNDEN